MRPSQVLDVQAELIDRTRDANYREFLKSYYLDQYRVEHGPNDKRSDVPLIAEAFADRMHEAIRMAEAYWVSGDMLDLVNFANESLQDTARLELDLPPSPYGFVYLDKPLEIQELRGRTMSIRVIMWAPMMFSDNRPYHSKRDVRAILFTAFTDVQDEDGVTKVMTTQLPTHVAVLGRYQLSHFDVWMDQQRAGPALLPVDADYTVRSASSLNDKSPIVWPWSFNLLRWMVTYWTMMNQTVVVSSREPAERTVARRVRRYRIPERVTIVQLRRRESDKGYAGDTSVEWQHRWMVKGHWRNQPCGTGRHDVKRIWIHPFIKGPADKPLIQTTKVYALTR